MTAVLCSKKPSTGSKMADFCCKKGGLCCKKGNFCCKNGDFCLIGEK